MTEINSNYFAPKTVNTMPKGGQSANAYSRYGYATNPPQLSIRDEFVKQHKKNGLIERLYNGIKNLTGLGTGSKKAEAAVKKAEAGEISDEEARNTIKKYRNSQVTSAQILGDITSIAAGMGTYFGLRKEAKMQHYIIELNKKFGKNDIIEQMIQSSKGNWKDQAKEVMCKILAKAAGSKTKLAVVTTGFAALVAGITKLWIGRFNRIGSKEFTTDKKDFNNIETEYDKTAYKFEKKHNRRLKRQQNWRNFFSGAINGLMMPITLVGKAVVGVPLYLAGNNLNRYFVGGTDENGKSFKGYVDNLKNDAITHAAMAAAIAVPLVKQGRFAAVFDKNIQTAFDSIMKNEAMIANPYQGQTAYKELEDILLHSSSIDNIINGRNLSIDEKIAQLTDENIFAVKFKQIQESGMGGMDADDLTRALQENCPPTRTLDEAAKYIEENLGKGYVIKENMGTGTVAETYLAEKDGKKVCIKILKKGINKEKIEADKNKFINMIKNLEGKTEAEKQYLIKNVEDLAAGISKEVDFKNEMEAAQQLVNYTKTANVVKPIAVKNNVYVMEKAEGISFKKLLELNTLDNRIKRYEDKVKKAVNPRDKEMWQNTLEHYQKEKEQLATKYKDLILNEEDINYMIDEYMKVLVEQLYKTDNKGRVLHADIHPGNIFIDVKTLKARKGNIFTLIDTGNTVRLTAEQAEKSMKLTQFIERGNTTDIAKYFISDADLSASKFANDKAGAEKALKEALDGIFFDSQTRLNTLNNTEIINITSNIMKQMDIMPGSTQLNLEKARTSADKSFDTLLNMWANEAGTAIDSQESLVNKFATAVVKSKKLLNKYGEYQELQKAQEKKNLLSMFKNPKEFFTSHKNPNNKERNSVEYLTYHMKQGITDPTPNSPYDIV